MSSSSPARSAPVPEPVLPPAPRPTSWKSGAPLPTAGTTFAAQPALPPLPVPALRATLARLAASLRPLARDEAEYAAAAGKVERFGQSGGVGERLQARLESRREEAMRSGESSWLERWWDDLAYLGYRDSVVVNVSYYYGFHRRTHEGQNPVRRAAELTRSALLFRRALYRGEIAPEGSKAAPFCMDTFRWMFDCGRVPGPEGLDWSVSYSKPEKEGLVGHIVVLRQGRFWKLDVARDGRLLSTEELQEQLQHIIKESDRLGPGEGLGALTASNRDVWAQDQLHLRASAANDAHLRTLYSAAFVLCLDTDAPRSEVAFSRQLWHGGAGVRNRWVDKPVQLIVCDDGAAGIMGEHSVMDGTPTVTLCDWMLTQLERPDFDHGAGAGTVAPAEEMRWDVDPRTRAAVVRAEQAAAELVGGQELRMTRTAYGKRAIKAFGVSPDSWAQMVVQLAYARLRARTGAPRPGGTYEAATTRRFAKGRTEAIRVVTSESEAWVRSMLEERAGAERRALFEAAAKKHVELAKAAGAGEGVDRHLLGLKLSLEKGEPVPELFEDALVKRSSYWALSTSAVFSRHFEVYGWGEVVPDGFGVAYMTGFDDYLQYTITSRKEMPNAEFVEEIERAAEELYTLFEDRAKL
ncbi:carnitine acetyl transferase [Dentipellis sp. KUC8613]|nr:carnitine acetyl transferase [Dentipellis sp. KUC8613]